jgi:hypothetical protein
MLPITLLAAQKVLNLLSGSNGLQQQINALSVASNIQMPPITSTQIVLSSANPDIGDRNMQLSYPRICLYSSALKNTQNEKFRSLSGTVSVIAEIWASGNLVDDTDQWIHFYVEAMTMILRQNIGDWGDGFFFSGVYDVRFQPPKAGGLGFVESASITCTLNISRN